MPSSRPFMTAEWRYLLMLNYEIEPEVLLPLLPAGVELDDWQGKTIVSMVGFLFQKTRVLGMALPFHTNFEEVNLRFYVRRKVGDEWRRGVVFVKEIVPKVWIARVARWLYRENYVALPMRHTIEQAKKPKPLDGSRTPGPWLVEYTWRLRKSWKSSPSNVSRMVGMLRPGLHRMGGLAQGEPLPISESSEEEFITEHYWGYNRLGKNTTGEYQVDHPRWRVWTVAQPYLLCDVQSLYGEAFAAALNHRPRSAFLAEGSPVAVYWGKRFKVH